VVAVYPLLAVVWALVLLPPMIRRRVRHRSELAELDRIRLCFVGASTAVSHQMDDAPRPSVRRSATRQRRRVLAVIGAGMVATLAAAVIVRSRVAWGMHLLVYDVLIAYVGLLAHSRDKKAKRRYAVTPYEVAQSPYANPARLTPRTPSFPSPSFPSPARTPRPALLQAVSR